MGGSGAMVIGRGPRRSLLCRRSISRHPFVEVDVRQWSCHCLRASARPVFTRAPSAYAAIGVAGELERKIVPNNSCIGRFSLCARECSPSRHPLSLTPSGEGSDRPRNHPRRQDLRRRRSLIRQSLSRRAAATRRRIRLRPGQHRRCMGPRLHVFRRTLAIAPADRVGRRAFFGALGTLPHEALMTPDLAWRQDT